MNDNRTRIVDAAADLLRDRGPAAVTTRGVAEAAGVQAPTIYRLFGDKDGLLDAVAEHVMTEYVAAKASVVAAAEQGGVDPADDLRTGWDDQIAFGLANPALFRLLSDPDRVVESAAARTGRAVLATRVHRLAEAGRLRVGEDRALDMIQAAGVGSIQALLAMPADRRDPGLADAMFTAVTAQILAELHDAGTAQAASGGPIATAVALRARSRDLEALTGAEQSLLEQWLDRVIRAQ